MLEQVRLRVEQLENVNNELSASNLAILCLPLLMVAPPISLFESVLNTAKAWYLFATGILAALSLLTQGMDLVIIYPLGGQSFELVLPCTVVNIVAYLKTKLVRDVFFFSPS